MDGDLDFVNVAIRIKSGSHDENNCVEVISKEPPILLLVDRSQTFIFDNIFTEEISQKSIYDESVKPFVEYVKEGYNCTVFAYGQTGTGKTYTMGTDPNVKNERDLGLIPRTLQQFFDCNNDIHSDIEISLSLSFIEIYNEKVFDLLQSDNKPPLRVKGLKAQGFTQEKVFNSHEAKHFLEMGNRNRHTAGTKQNPHSSRSHAIFTIYCNVKHKDKETCAKLNLVDLAGCESVRRTGTYGSAFHEGISINRGLLSIGQVMTALSNGSSYIPYRQSVITSILQDSLNRHNFVSLIACISPHSEDSTETVQTLEFAQRVKKMKSKPEVNEIISHYKKDNPSFFPTRFTTPFKRSHAFQTPRVTKKVQALTKVPEPNVSNNTDRSHSPESLSSSVASSISSIAGSSLHGADLNQQTLSPVIRKYMNAMEVSLMDKMEVRLMDTIKRLNGTANQRNKENDECGTPCLPWNKLQNELTKIRSEIAQLTSTRSKRAASSPIGESIDNIRKTLNYDDSPLNGNSNEKYASSNEAFEFKVPAVPLQSNKSNRWSSALSPIENLPPAPRRSIRLSIKRLSHQVTLQDIEMSMDSTHFMNDKSLERSARKNNKNNQHSEELFKGSSRKFSMSLRDRSSIVSKNLSINDDECRVNKKKELGVFDTPAGKRLLKGNSKDSPCTSHTKEALNVLNKGSIRDLVKLHSIGPKTAQQIHLFRTIKGKLNNISDLRQIPGWGERKFQKFVDENFLKKELI